MLLWTGSGGLNRIVALSFVGVAILSEQWCSVGAKSRKIDEQCICVLTCILFLGGLCVECGGFKAIELEVTMLLEFLERHRARH